MLVYLKCPSCNKPMTDWGTEYVYYVCTNEVCRTKRGSPFGVFKLGWAKK